MKKLLMLSLCFALTLGFTGSYASEDSKENTQSGYTNIIIKGEKNIKAYEQAGIIKTRPKITSKSFELEGIQTRGSSIPKVLGI